MDKRLTTLFCGGLLASVSFVAHAAGFVHESCTVGDRPFVEPLEFARFYFDGAIKLSEKPEIKVTRNGETMATPVSMEVENYEGRKRTQGSLAIFFDGTLLPKGESYELEIAPGSILLEDDASASNDAISVTMQIPDSLGDGQFELTGDDNTIVTEDSFCCYWGIETKPVGNPEWILYREEIPVRRYPAVVDSDWDLGQARVNFGEKINFENGVSYRLVLPAGSVSASRDDITNTETILEFTGGYTKPIEYPHYSWCSLFSGLPDVVDEVIFHFEMPIILTPGIPFAFFAEDGSGRWEAIPELSVENGLYIVTVHFGGIEPESGTAYSIDIPEGSIVSAEGDIAVNENMRIPLEPTTVAGLNDERIRIRTDKNAITVIGAETGTDISIFNSKGERIRRFKTTSDTLTIDSLPDDIYIVKAGGTEYKVRVR